jgi:hypothetical protein
MMPASTTGITVTAIAGWRESEQRSAVDIPMNRLTSNDANDSTRRGGDDLEGTLTMELDRALNLACAPSAWRWLE